MILYELLTRNKVTQMCTKPEILKTRLLLGPPLQEWASQHAEAAKQKIQGLELHSHDDQQSPKPKSKQLSYYFFVQLTKAPSNVWATLMNNPKID